MVPETGDQGVHRVEHGGSEEAGPQFQVRGEEQFRLQVAPRPLPEFAAPEHPLLLDQLLVGEVLGARVQRQKAQHHLLPPLLVQAVRPPHEPLDRRLPGEDGRNGVEGAPVEHVVRVQPAHDGAAPPVQPLLDGAVLPAVRTALPVGQVLLVLADDADRIVRTAAVHDDELEVRVVLAEHRVDARLQVLAVVVGGGCSGGGA